MVFRQSKRNMARTIEQWITVVRFGVEILPRTIIIFFMLLDAYDKFFRALFMSPARF